MLTSATGSLHGVYNLYKGQSMKVGWCAVGCWKFGIAVPVIEMF